MLNGKPVADLPLSERARVRNREIGFIFQSFNLIGDLTVYENVELPLTYRGMKSAERKERVDGGARARRHGAPREAPARRSSRAVSSSASPWPAPSPAQPSILLADEPTGNLDSKNGEAVMELLRELHRDGATICMVTHDPRYARARRPLASTCSTAASSKRTAARAAARKSSRRAASTSSTEKKG